MTNHSSVKETQALKIAARCFVADRKQVKNKLVRDLPFNAGITEYLDQFRIKFTAHIVRKSE